MRKILNAFFEWALFLSLLFLSFLLAVKKSLSGAVLQGITLWVTCVLPAMFPYFFITAILSSLSVTGKFSRVLSPVTEKVFKVNGAVGYAFFMSLLSGYPVGAKLVCELRENHLLSDSEAVRASALCSNSSPMFMIGSVGNVIFKNATFGFALCLCHFLSVIVTGFIFSFYRKDQPPTSLKSSLKSSRTDNVFYQSVYSSVLSVLSVGGIITLFYLFIEIILATNILSPLIHLLSPVLGGSAEANGLVFGVLECTSGLKFLSKGGISFFTLPIATCCCSFGGLSVLMQSTSFLKKAKIKTAPFLLSKVVSAVLGFAFGVFFTICFF